MLSIRLARVGRKNQPTYRVVLQDKNWSTHSKVLEILGHMNPHTNPATVVLKQERIKHWISKGAETSATVHNVLVTAGIVDGKKRRVVFGKKAQAAEDSEKPKA